MSAKIAIHSLQTAQIIGSNPIQFATLKQNKISIKVLFKYVNYGNIFLFDLVIKLPYNMKIKKYIIKIKKVSSHLIS